MMKRVVRALLALLLIPSLCLAQSAGLPGGVPPTWNSGTTYTIGSQVNYQGGLYVSIQQGSNQNPQTATSYWTFVLGIGAFTTTGSSGASTYNSSTGALNIPSYSGGGGCTNALTLNNSGSGAASGSTFDCSAAVTLSYNTLGAASSGANSNITSLTGLTTPLTVPQGGTGVGTHTAYGLLAGGTTSTGAEQTLAVGTAKQTLVSGGSAALPGYVDEPTPYYSPSANCVNSVPGSGWSLGSSGVVTCRAGTNNQSGFVAITDTSTSFAQFNVHIPADWDSGTDPYIRFDLAYPGTDGSSSHTIIPAIKVSCTGTAGTTSDDVTFNASHSSSTITLSSATANLFFSSSTVQLNSTDVTGCAAGGMMIVQVGRATDTATSAANFYGATVTFPRLITVQAN